MAQISFRLLDGTAPGPFGQYLLPQARRALAEGCPYTLLGAVWDDRACGAAAVSWLGGDGELLSLFVDPAARRQGVAGHMLALLLEEGARRGQEHLTASYTLRGEELDAMDALFRRLGGAPEDVATTYMMDSTRFHRPPVGAAFQPRFTPHPAAVPFSRLSPQALEALEGEAVPPFLRPSAFRDRMDGGLSLAWMEGDRIISYLLGTVEEERTCVLLSAWRSPETPAASFLPLLLAWLNLCRYRMGGEFRCCLSAVSPQAQALVERIAGGDYEIYRERQVLLPIPKRQEGGPL